VTSDVPSPDVVVAALRDHVKALPVPVVGSLIYGSVAKGSHHADSDVDAVLVTERPLVADERETVVRLYTGFVLAVGLRPDTTYPVELFPIEDCRRLLDPRYPDIDDRRPAPGDVPYQPDDAWELLYALVMPHRCVTGDEVVTELRRAAHQRIALLRRWGVAAHDLDDGQREPTRR
jgi:hypothetical protein